MPESSSSACPGPTGGDLQAEGRGELQTPSHGVRPPGPGLVLRTLPYQRPPRTATKVVLRAPGRTPLGTAGSRFSRNQPVFGCLFVTEEDPRSPVLSSEQRIAQLGNRSCQDLKKSKQEPFQNST
ncbi:UNVERIFIED_CONTAM: hypothetical protein K2H54_040698 [Gekko kuhli]